LIIVCAFASLDEQELKDYKPTLVYFDGNNNISHSSHSIPVQAA
jgi:aspartate 1-decarboxylase